MDNPSAFITEDCQISSSQEEILSHCPLTEDPFNSPGDGVRPTLPETARDAGEDMGCRDIFTTPPEKQSSAFDFRPCTRHKAVQTDDETQDFDDFTRIAGPRVDLSNDSDLGSPLAQLIQMTEHTMGAGGLGGNYGASVIEISNREIDKFQISGLELSPRDKNGEPPHKIMKTSEKNPGSKTSQAYSEIEPQQNEDNLQTCEGDVGSNQKSPCNFAIDPQPQQNIQIGNETSLGVSGKKKDFSGISAENNLGSGGNLESHISQSEIARNTEECVENFESKGTMDEIAETHEKKGDEQQKLRMLLPFSIHSCLKDIAKRKKENGEDVNFVFDVFKCLTQGSSKKDSLESFSWLELAKSKGIIFPTPRWWKETNN